MESVRHICWGESGKGGLLQRNALLGISESITPIVDNFTGGDCMMRIEKPYYTTDMVESNGGTAN